MGAGKHGPGVAGSPQSRGWRQNGARRPGFGISRSVRPGSGAPLVTSPVAVTKPVSFLVLMSSQACLLPRLPLGGSPPASARSPVPSVCPPSSSWLPELEWPVRIASARGVAGLPVTDQALRQVRASPRSWLVADLSPRLCLGPQTGHRSS